MRRFPAAVSVSLIAVFLPFSVFALGLGEIDLRSALNQPFLAEIAVSSDSSDELAALSVELADVATFERYGLDRPAFLSDFTFTVLRDAGDPRIRIASSEPVTEPFVTLLLEVSWPQGRLLREFTVLLDPPVFGSGANQPAPAAEISQPAPVSRPDPAPRPAPTSRQPSTPRNVPVTPAAVESGGGSYGPVQRNETLWGISQQLRPDATVGINQMMIAIYRANPEAFAGNINRLKQGAVLRVPDRASVARLSSGEAFAEVKEQNRAWRSAATESPRLRLVPPEEAVEAPSVSPAEAPSVSSEEAPAPEAASGGDAAALQQRVEELESELDDSRRLIELRDQELGALQDRLELLESREAEVEAGVEAPAGTPPATAAPAERPAVPPAATTATTRPEEPSFLASLLRNWLLYVAMAVVVVAVLFVARRRRQVTDDETGRWEALTADDVDIDEETRESTERMRAPRISDEAILVEEEKPPQATDHGGAEAARADAAAESAADVDELPLEKTISADSAVNLDGADPLAEADFHMAYGLYDQAADILIAARQAEPDRSDLQLKLLEVYFVWENRDAFLQEAQAMHAGLGDTSSPEWNKVLIMGKQICPDEPLFAAAPTGGEGIDLSIGEGDDAGLDFDLAGDGDDEGLDFDLGEAEEEAESRPEQSTIVDYARGDSPTVETPTIETEGPGIETVETPTIETPATQSGSTMETPTIETPAGVDQTAEIELDDLGLDLEGLDDEIADFDDGADEADTGHEDSETLLDDLDAGETALRKTAGGLDNTAEFPVAADDDFDDESGDVDSTAEMPQFDTDEKEGADLSGLTAALEKSIPPPAADSGGDTVEQPGVAADNEASEEEPGGSETAEFPASGDSAYSEDVLSGTGSLGADLDFEFEEDAAAPEEATGTMDTRQSPVGEGPTMTEVGTKLDLARAYVDMGDPDGARSILNEVLEEGEEGQRQEAQKLLEDLDG